ncbi:MAG: histidinol phosphate phosphatase [Zetaproteobacteria bacterium CG2_30_46_52]|nr:MAG: histidinol phosphate phosphatase [Zetaproteobacteria bacterium CG2_30_46_52]
MKKLKLVLLDRDGVINFDSPDYILSPDQWQPIPGSLEAIALLKDAGLFVAICSNQSGLGRGMMSQDMFEAIQNKMVAATQTAGGSFDVISYCPHNPEAGCDCRKPKAGLLLQVLRELGVNPDEAVMVGDSLRDVQAAIAAGVSAVLVSSGYGDAQSIWQKAQALQPGIKMYDNLASYVETLLLKNFGEGA